jgi:sugar phosphate isomerase/epimerase
MAGEDLLHARQVLDGRLVNVHFSDMGSRMPLASFPPARKMLDQHRFPGTGDLALSTLLAALGQGGYTGPVTLEVSPFFVSFWWLPSVRRRLVQAREWMKGQLVTR